MSKPYLNARYKARWGLGICQRAMPQYAVDIDEGNVISIAGSELWAAAAAECRVHRTSTTVQFRCR
jgi:hypothetical protein